MPSHSPPPAPAESSQPERLNRDKLILGRGRLGRTLQQGLRSIGHRVHLAAAPRSAQDCAQLEAIWPKASLVFLAVPDDAIAQTAACLPWRSNQAAVHCSAALALQTLDAARLRGAEVGGFHPLQIFADPKGSAPLLAGSAVAIEAGPALAEELAELAKALQMRPFFMEPSARTLYHLAANFSASFMLATLGEALHLWERAGLQPQEALSALMPLARASLQQVQERGLAGALSGPVARGDVAVVRAHLDALERAPHDPASDALKSADGLGSAQLYRALAWRQLGWLQDSERLDAGKRAALERLLRPSSSEVA